MSDIEFQDYVNSLIDNSIMNCDDEIKEQDIEKCNKCMQNMGSAMDKGIICLRELEEQQ